MPLGCLFGGLALADAVGLVVHDDPFAVLLKARVQHALQEHRLLRGDSIELHGVHRIGKRQLALQPFGGLHSRKQCIVAKPRNRACVRRLALLRRDSPLLAKKRKICPCVRVVHAPLQRQKLHRRVRRGSRKDRAGLFAEERRARKERHAILALDHAADGGFCANLRRLRVCIRPVELCLDCLQHHGIKRRNLPRRIRQGTAEQPFALLHRNRDMPVRTHHQPLDRAGCANRLPCGRHARGSGELFLRLVHAGGEDEFSSGARHGDIQHTHLFRKLLALDPLGENHPRDGVPLDALHPFAVHEAQRHAKCSVQLQAVVHVHAIKRFAYARNEHHGKLQAFGFMDREDAHHVGGHGLRRADARVVLCQRKMAQKVPNPARTRALKRMRFVEQGVQVRLPLRAANACAHLLIKPGLVEQFPDEFLHRNQPALRAVLRKLLKKRVCAPAENRIFLRRGKKRFIKRPARMRRAQQGEFLVRESADAGKQHRKQRHVLPAVVDHAEQISKNLHLHRVEISAAGLRIGGHAAGCQRLRNRLRLRSRAQQHGKITIAIVARFARFRVDITLRLHDLVDAPRDQPRLDLQIRRILQRVLVVLALGALFAD